MPDLRFMARDAAHHSLNGELEALFERHETALFRLVQRYVKNEQDARETLQRVFLRAFENLPQFRGESSLRSWLYRIAVNTSLHQLRDARPFVALEHASEPETHPFATYRLAAQQARSRLAQAIETLPDKQRRVVELRIFQELSFREIGEALGSSEDTAKANFHHAMKRLRDVLQPSAEPYDE